MEGHTECGTLITLLSWRLQASRSNKSRMSLYREGLTLYMESTARSKEAKLDLEVPQSFDGSIFWSTTIGLLDGPKDKEVIPAQMEGTWFRGCDWTSGIVLEGWIIH